MKKIYGLALGLLGLVACDKSDEKPPLVFTAPSHFPATVYKFQNNPINQATFDLGKALFYDGILSRDGSVSCGSCHQQGVAFVHGGHDVSHGIDDKLGVRNAPPVFNLAWQPEFFWDGGVGDLDLFSIAPITNEVEMDETMPNVIQKLQNSTRYKALYKEAFGTSEVTTARTMKALSQFMLMIVSANSRYDQYKQGNQTALTAQEIRGLNLVREKCNSCHSGELFTNYSYQNNGLRLRAQPDSGRYRITLLDKDLYRFKVPTLRNVAVTAPYMHDGRFYTLEAVLEHYTTAVQPTPNLAPELQKADGSRGISLSAQEQQDIIAFLNALTDQTLLRDTRFSE